VTQLALSQKGKVIKMSDSLWLVIAAFISFIGMAWIALSFSAHWQQIMQRPSQQHRVARQLLRALGYLCVLLALLACLMADHPSIAILAWLMLSTASAFLVANIIAWRPSFLRFVWVR
jgi:TRAP-type uncharacterized transport system fused permease subunit